MSYLRHNISGCVIAFHQPRVSIIVDNCRLLSHSFRNACFLLLYFLLFYDYEKGLCLQERSVDRLDEFQIHILLRREETTWKYVELLQCFNISYFIPQEWQQRFLQVDGWNFVVGRAPSAHPVAGDDEWLRAAGRHDRKCELEDQILDFLRIYASSYIRLFTNLNKARIIPVGDL